MLVVDRKGTDVTCHHCHVTGLISGPSGLLNVHVKLHVAHCVHPYYRKINGKYYLSTLQIQTSLLCVQNAGEI